MTTSPDRDSDGDPQTLLACVVLAHTDPVHVRRLVAALAPLPVFLHCDRSTPATAYEEMVTGLRSGVTLLPRMATGWAKWENVAAEIAGYRAVLETTAATHVALLTGSDYPLAATSEILEFLSRHPDRSLVTYHRLPHPDWGRGGGVARLRYRHRAYRKHMLRLPIPRRLPTAIVPAGGSQVKILSRRHVRAVVDLADSRPDITGFWRRSWVADETFVASVLSSPGWVPGWAQEHLDAHLWWIDWNGPRQKSPPWLGMKDFTRLADARAHGLDGMPFLFARKFSTDHDTAVLDAIDADLRGGPTRE